MCVCERECEHVCVLESLLLILMRCEELIMIVWPVVLKYEGVDELTFVSDQNEWDTDTDLHGFSYETTDVMIDSAGLNFIVSLFLDLFQI